MTRNKRRKTSRSPLGAEWTKWIFRRPEEQRPEPSAPPSPTRPRRSPAGHPRTSAWYLVLFFFAVIAASGAFVVHLNVRFEGVRLGYETSRARAERSRLLVERRELRLELASLKSPARVESEARERLGMEMPDHTRIIPIGKKLAPVLASGRAR
jgi:cell division protein FtsL